MISRYRRWGLALLALVLVVPACTVDDEIFTEVGSIRIYLVDPSLDRQKFKNSEATVQTSEWWLHRATLLVEGAPEIDLLGGDDCKTTQTVELLEPITVGTCASGIVVGTTDELLSATLELQFTMRVRRARPADLPVGGDYDGDGFVNESDSCPLVFTSPRQQISACTQLEPISGSTLIDSDGDRVPDTLDNCLWIPNNNPQGDRQDNTTGLAARGIPDGIGDACTEQVGEIEEVGLLILPVELPPQGRGLTLLGVDFDNKRELDCDWDQGKCVLLQPDSLRTCATTDSTDLLFGCPESVTKNKRSAR